MIPIEEKTAINIVAQGIRAVRESDPEQARLAHQVPLKGATDGNSSLVVAVLIVVLQHHLDVETVNVSEVSRLAVKELSAGGVVKISAFGGVLSAAQDLLEDNADKWRDCEWCKNDQDAWEHDHRSHAGAEEEPRQGSPALPNLDSDEDVDEVLEEHRTTEIPLSRCGPMAQAHTDWYSPARRREYAQWKSKILKRIEAIEQQA